MEMLQEASRSTRPRSNVREEFLSRQRYRLEKARSLLLRELGNASESGRLRRGGAAESSCTRAREVTDWLESRLRRRLDAVERALRKIEEGTYGTCDATGEAISPEKLEAVPETVCTPQAQRGRTAR